MSTITKSWAFLNDLESLVDLGASSSIAVAWEGADANFGAVNGCAKFTSVTAGLSAELERLRKETSISSDTWETWGVPAGATVTNIEITAWKFALQDSTGLTSVSLRMRVVTTSGGSVTDTTGDLVSSALTPSIGGSWNTGGDMTARAVDTVYQDSSTRVYLEIEWQISTSGTTSVDHRFDTIDLLITYTAAPAVPVSQSPPDDFDIRLYNADGLRQYLPETWIEQCNFEILERGGYGQGGLQIGATWEDLQLLGNERVDVYVFGTFMYRGFVRVSENEIVSTEKSNPTLYGLMERFGKWQTRCRYAYSTEVDISTVFEDIVNDWVKTADRLPSIQVDFDSIGVTIQQFDPVGMSVAQAFNALCDIAPLQVIWGVDVDSIHRDRVYFRTRSTAIAYRYSIGGAIRSFVYPRDISAITNRLFITGGQVAQPNLVKNGSFENPLPNSETVGNLLVDYSFEDNNVAWTLTGSRKKVGDAGAFGAARTGVYWLELDQNTEKGEQTVSGIDYRQVLIASFWARRETAATARSVKGEVDGLTSGSALVVTKTITAYADPGSGDYTKYFAEIDFSAYPTVAKAKFRVQTNGGTASNDGVLVDDTALYERDGVANSGWKYSVAGTALRVTLDWRHKDISAYEGCYSVKVLTSGIALSSDYLEIRNTQDKRFQLKPTQRYTLIVRFRKSVTNCTASIGIVEYKSDGTVAATTESSTFTVDSTTWGIVAQKVTTNANTVNADVFVRVRSNQILYIDAIMMIEGDESWEFYSGSGAPAYWEADEYQKKIDVANALLVDLDTDVADSITDYGDREEEVSNTAVVDFDTAKKFATGYFNAHALPLVQASLSCPLKDVSELPGLDGTVRLLNLPSPPPALFPSRLRFTLGANVDVDMDLGNEKPDLAQLIQLTQETKRIKGL